MLIFGIDPGMRCTGFAVIDWNAEPSAVALGFWRPSCKHLACHVRELDDIIEWWLQTYRPDSAAMEMPFVHPRFPASALQLERIMAVITTTLVRAGCSWTEYPTRVIKRSVTGFGHADKAAVRRYLLSMMPSARYWRHMPDDAFDALAVAYCHGLHGPPLPLELHLCEEASKR